MLIVNLLQNILINIIIIIIIDIINYNYYYGNYKKSTRCIMVKYLLKKAKNLNSLLGFFFINGCVFDIQK